MAEVLVVGKKISEMDLVTDIVGDEKIPTGVVGDKAVTTGQLLTYLDNNGKVQWGRIEGDIANQTDLQSQFSQQLATLQNHIQDQDNPHNVTKEQVGLGLADNTADMDKPVSTAVQEALSLKADQTYVDDSLANKTHNSLLGRDADGAHPASAILDGSGVTQQQVNDLTGAPYRVKAGGYSIGERVVLESGDVVINAVAGNTVDPNVDMTGWLNPREKQDKKNLESVSTADFGSVGKAQNIPVSDWYTPGSAYYRGYADLAAVQVDYPHVTSATNTVDWAAAQAAVNHQGAYGQCLIDGCLFFAQGETLVLPLGFKLFGKDPNLFINTNSGNYFVGALTGQIPKYGIYYDGTTGVAISAAAGVCLEDFHLFGKGYTVADGSVNILDIGDANVYDTIGVEVAKFITTKNMSVFYLGTAFNTVGGNYYSRFYNTEVTRCNVAFSYTVTTYNQHFYGCIIRNTPTPFFFDSGVACRNFNYFGGSIEGYRPKGGNIYAIGVPANSILRFEGTYFENLDTFGTFDSVFGFKGGNCYLQLNGCTVYLNHYNNFVRQAGFTLIRVRSVANEFYLSAGSRTKNPTIYNLSFIEGSSYLYTDGTDKINFSRGYPSKTVSGSIALGSTALTVSAVVDLYVGQRVIVRGSQNLETVVTAINGNVLTLRNKAKIDYSEAVVEVYYTPNYIAPSLGLNLLSNADIHFPSEYLPQFDSVKFNTTSGEVRAALSDAPGRPFDAQTRGLTTYVADYVNWNPSGKSDGRGAYPVVFRGGKYYPQLGSFAGSFTFAAGTAFTVPDTNVAASSKIMLMPTNAAAATLFKGGVYISSKGSGTGFTVTALTTAVGTETFDYTITD